LLPERWLVDWYWHPTEQREPIGTGEMIVAADWTRIAHESTVMPRAMGKTAAKSATMWLAWTMTGDGAGITRRIGTITITIWEFTSVTTMMTTVRVTMMTTIGDKASRGRGRLDSARIFSPQQSLNQTKETNFP
jgi:hypothetical protein